MYALTAPAYSSPEKVAELQARIDAQPVWFHRFELTNGVTTPGADPSARKLHALSLPDRLDGQTVIDVGAFEGYFSFQCEARGAARVVASDRFIWEWPGYGALANFRLMKDALQSSVEEVHVEVPALSSSGLGTFDVALFLGVLYHAPNMVEYLQQVRSVTRRLAVVESLVDMLDVDEPCAAYYPAGVLGGDGSNWWGPNLACVEDMLRRVGFSDVRLIGLWDVNQRDALQGKLRTAKLKSARAVWHAYV